MERHDVVVVGAGQAGLAMSWHLSRRGIEHVALERRRIAERWRSERWDSLAFQFPNWMLSLPGLGYEGSDPDGFSSPTDVVAMIESYAELQSAPVRVDTDVASVRPRAGGGWEVRTSEGVLVTDVVVAATGPFQAPRVPALAAALPPHIHQVHSMHYRNPSLLPDGGVLVVGSGASGTQIAEDLLAAGRPVHLAVNRHRRLPRRYRGRDALWWLELLGVMNRTRSSWDDGRMPPTLLVTGVGGGHDMNVRALHAAGAGVLGRLLDVDDSVLTFDSDAEEHLAAADAAYLDFIAQADAYVDRERLDLEIEPIEPAPARPVPVVSRLDLVTEGITSVVWATGHRFDFAWVGAPFLDETGEPVQERGVTQCPGLYVLGLHWMHTFRSGVFFGVGDDAAYLTDHIASRLGAAHRS